MRIIGIDPGLDGAVALLEGMHVLTVVRVPTCSKASGKGREIMWDELNNAIRPLLFEADHAFIEQVGIRPRQSAQAGVAQGVNAGGIIGLVVAAGVPRTIVSPTVWKTHMGLVTVGSTATKEKKARSRMKATALWPRMAHEFKRSSDDGPAEAALIAYWGYGELTKKGFGDDAKAIR